MRRRRFISLLGASLAASPWAPSAIRAQGPGPIRRIGVLIGLSASDPAGQAELVAFREGLAALGWIEGRNLKIEYRWPGFETDRMRAAARELAELKPEVIVTRTTPGTLAVRSEITRTPIVFVVVAEPIESGLVQSMSRPGGNITGFTNFESGVSGKWLELLKTVAPQVSRVALMYNPKTAPFAPVFMRDAENAARALEPGAQADTGRGPERHRGRDPGIGVATGRRPHHADRRLHDRQPRPDHCHDRVPSRSRGLPQPQLPPRRRPARLRRPTIPTCGAAPRATLTASSRARNRRSSGAAAEQV